jgi:hypothetical protein
MYELTRDQALGIYLGHADTPAMSTGVADEKLIPSTHLSERTDADDGWHFRNIDGWLATVYDDGHVDSRLTDDLDLDQERQRGTRGEVYALTEVMTERTANRGDMVYNQPPKHTSLTIMVSLGEPAPRESVKVEVSVGAEGDE